MAGDPLEWWRVNGHRLPNLSRMARDYLPFQSTSAASERAFSSSGQTCTTSRNRLNAASIQATQCLKSWAKIDDIN